MGTTKYHLYQQARHKNYNYVDDVTRTYIEMGGMLIHIYPLLGVVDSNGNVTDITATNEMAISDVVLNENNKRKYSHTTYDMYVTTTLNPPNFSWSYAGISILDGDVLEMSCHYNMMVETLGRKFIVGDVIEISAMRDLDVLGKTTGQNKFYVVTSSERDDYGWGPEYHYHLWKIKCKPIANSPEYADLFNNDVDEDGNPAPQGGEDGFYVEPGDENGGGGLDPNNTQDDKLQEQVDDILDEADGEDGSPENDWNPTGVSYRLHDEHHMMLAINDKYYITDGSHIKNRENIVGIDGIPAELNCTEVPYGDEFPKVSKENDYFLRIDYLPPRLYKRIYVKTQLHTANIICGDINITDGELNITGKNFDGSIKNSKGELVGAIDKDRVYVGGTYIGYVTDSGKIVNNGGLIIGEIKTEDVVHKKGWKLIEFDRRERWFGTPARLRLTVNNTESFVNEAGEVVKMRQNIKNLAKARIKKEHGKDRPWSKPLVDKIAEETGIDYNIIGQVKP